MVTKLAALALVLSLATPVNAEVTAYAPLDNQSGVCANNDPMHTATMTTPRRGVIAVDPEEIPYGTTVFIPGYGLAVAEDTGGAIRNNQNIAIDVCVDTYSEAMDWGRQNIIVYVFGKVE